MSPFCEALDSDACNCVLAAVLEDIEVATVQRLTLPYIESAGDDVQDTAMNGEEDAVYVVYGADAYVCEGRLLLLLLVLHASRRRWWSRRKPGRRPWMERTSMESRCT